MCVFQRRAMHNNKDLHYRSADQTGGWTWQSSGVNVIEALLKKNLNHRYNIQSGLKLRVCVSLRAGSSTSVSFHHHNVSTLSLLVPVKQPDRPKHPSLHKSVRVSGKIKLLTQPRQQETLCLTASLPEKLIGHRIQAVSGPVSLQE